MDLLIEIALKGVLPFFLGYYGMKVYYYFQGRKSK